MIRKHDPANRQLCPLTGPVKSDSFVVLATQPFAEQLLVPHPVARPSSSVSPPNSHGGDRY
jgi:hypothetical protein